MTSVTIGNSVTSIGAAAFYDCSSLTSVTVENPTPITMIHYYVFTNRENATLYVPVGSKGAYETANYWKDFKEIIEIDPSPAITFADNTVKTICVANWDTNHDGELSMAEAAAVTDLGEVFFNTSITSFDELQYFTGLTSVYFNGFVHLKKVTIPNSITSIGERAFAGCLTLSEVTIPNSVTSIGERAFAECLTLSEVTIPNSVTSIGDWAFYRCDSLTGIEIPNSVTTIGTNAFANCSSLADVMMPNGLTNIGFGAFQLCESLTAITIPASVTSIGSSAFSGCSRLASIEVDGDNAIYDSRDLCNAIIETSSNTLISGCNNTVIPTSVTSLGDNAFEGSCLTSITIPANVELIGENAFKDCENLTSVTVEWNEQEMIGGMSEDIFENVLLDQATLYVPAGTKSIYETAEVWKDFGNIIEIVPSPAITFADNAVKTICVANWDTNHDGGLSMAEAAAVTDLGTVFKENGEITSFDELQYFTGLTSLVGAFETCTSLKSIVIPSGVETINGYGFTNCTALESIQVDEQNTHFDSRNGCNAIIETATNTLVVGCQNTIIPNDVTTIGSDAFWGRWGMESMSIPSTVTSIGGNAFAFCISLKQITLPSSISNIDGQAFWACTGLTSVTVEWQEPLAVPENIFAEVPLEDAVLYVPAGTIADYQNADVWKDFMSVVAARSQGSIILDWGHLSPYQMRYIFQDTNEGVAPPTDADGKKWYEADYDDSSWDTLTCPISRGDRWGIGEGNYYNFENELGCFYLRRTFNVNLSEINTENILLKYDIDDDADFYLNGELVHHYTYNYSDRIEKVQLPANALVDGVNTIAIYFNDNGGGGWIDYSIMELFVDEYGVTYEYVPSDGENAEHYVASGLVDGHASDIVIKDKIYGVPVTRIGDYAFHTNGELTSVTLTSNELIVGDFAFWDCVNLNSIIVSSNVANIIGLNFGGSPLVHLTVVPENPILDSRDNCNAIIETATNTLKYGCKYSVIPNSVTSIDGWAFFASPLTSIDIPSSVTKVGEGAFGSIGNLKSFNVSSDVTSINLNPRTFECTPLDQAVLYVPEGAKAAYEAADVWKDFKEIIEKKANFADEFGVIYTLVPAENENAEHYEVTGVTEEYASDIVIHDKVSGLSVTDIGANAFLNCTNLASVTIPKSVKSIGASAFAGCASLTSLYVGWAEPLTVSESIFENVPMSQATLYVPAGTQTAYQATDVWKDFIIQEKEDSYEDEFGVVYTLVPEDGENAEHYVASGLADEHATDIVIKDKIYGVPVTRIGDYAFHTNGELTSVTLTSNELIVGDFAFWDCVNLNSIIVSSNVANIIGLNFGGSPLVHLTVVPENPILDSRDNCNAIIETATNTLKYGCKYSVIPNSVTSIDGWAFFASPLTSIDIPSSVTKVGEGAFGSIGNLKSFNVSSDVTSINLNPRTFECTPLDQAVLYVPEGAKAAYEAADVWKDFKEIIEKKANFADEFGVIYTLVPAENENAEHYEVTGVTEEYASDIVIHDKVSGLSVTDIGANAFLNCTNLASVTIPKSVKSIGASAFAGCASLTSLYVGWAEPLTVSESIFENVPMSQATLYVPAGTQTAYQATDVWKDFIIQEKEDSYEDEFGVVYTLVPEDGENAEHYVASGLADEHATDIVIKDKIYGVPVTKIGDFAFYGNGDLTSVTIPNSVTSIGDAAFEGCSGLTSITIPNSVTSIWEGAFANCDNLTSVTVEWDEPLDVSEFGVFESVPLDQATLYVPAGTIAAYQSADVWKDFGRIVEYTDLVENGSMEEEPSGDWSSFWVYEWRTMEEQFNGPANIVADPTNASNHCVKVVVRSEAEAREAGNMIEDDEGNYAVWESQFFIQSKVKLESGKRLRLTMRVRADKAAEISTQAHQAPGEYNHWACFDGINVTDTWQTVVREVVVTPEMTQEENGREMRTVAFNLATLPEGNVFYFDDIKLEILVQPGIIEFIDNSVKALCVDNWDTNHDGELSMDEAAAVTDLGTVFKGNEEITWFDELQYFTGLTSIGDEAFRNCSNLKSLTIPANVISVGQFAFNGNTGLQTVVIPENLTTIGYGAFSWCTLESVTIPASVTAIEEYAFHHSLELKSVTVNWSEPLAVPENIFAEVPLEDAVLYVPAGTIADYQTADVWKDFGRIVAFVDLVENGSMEEEPSGDWSSFWVYEWRTMEEQFNGPANIVADPTNASNHCVKVVVRSEAEAREAGNMIEDAEGNFAVFESQFFIRSKQKLESGKRLRLTMRIRADKATEIPTEAHQAPSEFNHWTVFGSIKVTDTWRTVVKEIDITPDMTQEEIDREMRTVAFNLATLPEGNVFYFDDIKLEYETPDEEGEIIDPLPTMGDVNGDGEVDIYDVTALIDIVLEGDNHEPYVFPQYDHEAADLNEDGEIDIYDVTMLIDVILNNE